MPEMIVQLPTLHAGQAAAYKAPGRFKAIRCGRRWGKTVLGVTIACDRAAKGRAVGMFAPDYKILAETFGEVGEIIAPIKTASSKIEGVQRTMTGGRVDYWSLENDRAGRSRKYHWLFVDEAAFAKPNMLAIWERSIKPALLDYGGGAVIASTPNGANTENFFYKICTEPKYGFIEYHAPTWTNPHLPQAELDKLKEDYPPMVYRQEFAAEFVDWSGEDFFMLAWMLDEGMPVPYPAKCDGVFAVIDTAIKDGRENDGTAVSFFAINVLYGTPLTLLDWDIFHMEGASLEQWLPSVFVQLEEFAALTKARNGSAGAYIEDRGSGTILLQQARNRGWNARPLPEELTAAGKSGRAMNVSPLVFQGNLKISEHAFNKVVKFKGATRNHWISQVTRFRIGAKEGMDDDLLDTMTYGIAIGMGQEKGYA